MSDFIEVVAKSTGRKQRVPLHWLGHPTLGKDFRLPPSVVARAVPTPTIEPKKATKKATAAKSSDD